MSVKWFGDSITDRLRKGVMVGVIEGTQLVKETMVRYIMEPPKTGKMYGKHQASAPGEKPANDTGNLVKNMRESYDPIALTGNVVVGTEYGLRLEYGFVGTDSAGRTVDQAPRPFARPALVEKEKDVRQAIIDNVAKVLK